ncbi:MAG: type II secretion system GspH family protein [Defluviitaleaceae bacterium]|nr:type II secretion system GspH family protein [Defluviitaleaceae bacterium]
MRKRNRGFSYIEVMVALTLFSILLMAALPLLGQAGRNLGFAQSGYEAHLAAQSIVLAVRDALPNAAAAKTAASQDAARIGAENYSVWVFNENPYTANIFFGSPNAPAANANLCEDKLSRFSFSRDTSVIVVVVWDKQMNIAGRAVGVTAL